MNGIVDRNKDDKLRGFLLTRAFFIGSQKSAAVWTGDTFATFDHLEASIPMSLAISTVGIPFVGADVGGFFGNPSEELLIRWYQAGATVPFYRAHAHIHSKRREPWLFSSNAKGLIKEAIQLRYKLIYYIYTLFRESSRSGMPVARLNTF